MESNQEPLNLSSSALHVGHSSQIEMVVDINAMLMELGLKIVGVTPLI